MNRRPKALLSAEAKRKLCLASLTSKTLFYRQINTIYKENVAENHETLVKKAIINQAKPVTCTTSSSRKPKASFW